MKKHYDILGLEEGASQEAIQEAYDRLYKELDPKKNKNQEFFIEEFEKLQAAYKVLSNSSILSTEKGIQNSNTKSSTPLSISSNNIELLKDSKKKKNIKLIMREKKRIVLFILLTVVIKIIVHFFVFPTEVIVTNTDKKIYVYKDIRELMRLKRGYDINKKSNNLIVNGDSVFYYPKEKEKVSLAKHIEETFTQKLWLFPWVIFLLLLSFWINYKSDKDKSNFTKKKHNFSYLSKQNIIVTLLLSLSISSNIYLFIKINKDNIPKVDQKTVSNEDTGIIKSNNYSADEASSSAEEASNYVEEASGYADDAQSYMNSAEEYMNNAEDYMNNAAQSAQDAEEFANSR
jgi:hypothetical protein